MGRRSNKEGSFRKLKSGSWLGQLMDGYTPEGKKRIINVTAPTKAEAQQKLRQYLADKENGKLISKTMLFSEWSELWYKGYQGQVQPSTYSAYRYTLNVLIKQFGSTPLNDIKQISINRFLNELNTRGLSHSLQSKCKAMLVQIFDAAEANDLILKNPARHAKCPKVLTMETGKSAKDSFTEEEFELLMEYLPNDLLGNSIRVMLVTGLRTQELLALTPADIEPDGSILHVTKAVKMVDGKAELGPPKSKRSRRDIPIPKAYRQYAIYLRENGGRIYIWTAIHRENFLVGVGTFRRKYKKLLAAIPGVRCLPPHCCRHTYVTRLQKNGVPMEMIARLAGHSDITTTDEYTHTSVETLSRMVDLLNPGDPNSNRNEEV